DDEILKAVSLTTACYESFSGDLGDAEHANALLANLENQFSPRLIIAANSFNGSASRTTTTARTYTCRFCAKGFTSDKYLSMHMSLHVADHGSPGGVMMTPVGQGETQLQEGEFPICRLKGATPGSASYWTCKICDKTFAQN